MPRSPILAALTCCALAWPSAALAAEPEPPAPDFHPPWLAGTLAVVGSVAGAGAGLILYGYNSNNGLVSLAGSWTLLCHPAGAALGYVPSGASLGWGLGGAIAGGLLGPLLGEGVVVSTGSPLMGYGAGLAFDLVVDAVGYQMAVQKAEESNMAAMRARLGLDHP